MVHSVLALQHPQGVDRIDWFTGQFGRRAVRSAAVRCGCDKQLVDWLIDGGSVHAGLG